MPSRPAAFGYRRVRGLDVQPAVPHTTGAPVIARIRHAQEVSSVMGAV